MLGERPRLIAAIGYDCREYFEWLGQNGIATDDIIVVAEEATASAFITTDLEHNQITFFNPGAMKQPVGFDFSGVNPEESISIVAPCNLADMADFTEQGARAGIYTIFDPGQSLPAWDGEGLTTAIGNSDLVIANEYEMGLIGDTTGLDEAGLLERTRAPLLRRWGGTACGLRRRTAGSLFRACRLRMRLTLRGPAMLFGGGLILGLARKEGLERAAQLGCACAHFAIRQPGTQEYRYTMDELEAALRRAYGG